MERRKVANKLSDMFILDSLILLLSATLVSAIEAEDNSGSGRPVWNIIQHSTEDLLSWTESSVEVKVGSNLTFSCLVDAFDLQYDVFRISLLQGDVLFPLVENGLVHAPFSDIPRYSAVMNEDRGNGGARMTIHVVDIQPEDAGTYICSKYLEGDNSATVNVTVLAPISDLFITSIDPDGDEMRMDADSEVFLQEHDFYGVGCIATVEGQTPPEVRIEIDGKDETESFQAIHQVDASVLPSGLTLWTSHVRLAFVSSTPNPDYNEKLMRCVASQTGFAETETTTRLLVQFAPLISCVPERLLARQGTSATLDCSIRANPGSRITWSSARGDLSNYPNVFFDETVLSSDETRLRLSIRDIRPINFQRYTLTAANIIASSQSTFELAEDETVAMETHPEVESFHPDEDSLLPPEMVEEVFPNGEDFPAMDANWLLQRTSFVREPNSTFSEVSSTFTEAMSTSSKASSTITIEAISTLPEASSTILDTSSSSLEEEDKITVAPDIITSTDFQSSLIGVRSALQNDDSVFLGTTLSDVESTFQNVWSAVPDVTSTIPTVTSTLPTVTSTIPTAKGALPTVIDALSTVKSSLPTVIITLPTVKNTLPTVKDTLPTVKNTLPIVKSTLPTVSTISPDATNIIQSVDNTLPLAKSTSPPEVKRTFAPVKTKSPSPNKKTTTIEFNLADPTIAVPSTRNPPHSAGKPHSSAGGRARSANHKGTSIPLKASKGAAALPTSTAAVPMMAPEPPNVAASSKDGDEEEEQLEQPLPAAAGEVHYSLSRSSSSSSSKKDSGKSGEASKSTSGAAAAIAVLQYVLASLLLIRWF